MNSSPEAKKRSDAAKAQALAEFKKRFPRANMVKFITKVEFDANRKALARVLFPDGDGSWENPLIEDSKCWSQPLKDALEMQQDGGFKWLVNGGFMTNYFEITREFAKAVHLAPPYLFLQLSC